MRDTLVGMPKEICSNFELSIPGALLGPSSASETKLITSDEKLISKLMSVMDNQLLLSLESSSLEDFRERRRSVFPRYVRALRALSDTVRNLIQDSEIDRIAERAISQVGIDLERLRGTRFEDKLVDQARFTLWTLGKMSLLGRKIAEAGKPKSVRVDYERYLNCQATSVWAQFHMDSIVAAMKFGKSPNREIQMELCDGLRAIVNSYAVMKEALEARQQVQEDLPVSLPWDDEDEHLLVASMRDLNDFDDASDC
jgi:hypothetical protein